MATSFDDFVDKQHQMACDAEQSVDWPKQLAEWRSHLGQFNDLVRKYLRKYTAQGKLRVENVTKKIEEQYIGAYEIDAIRIRIGIDKIDCDPVGTNLIGAKGRVDMKGPGGTVRFVLVPKESTEPRIYSRIRIVDDAVDDEPRQEAVEWTWKISTPPPRIEYVELQEELFLDAVMEVMNG